MASMAVDYYSLTDKKEDENGNVIQESRSLTPEDMANIIGAINKSGLIDKTVKRSVVGAAVIDNIIPVLQQIGTALPTVIDSLLGAIAQLLPTLVEAVTSLFSSLLETILELIPELIPTVVTALTTIIETLVENLPLLMEAIVVIFTSLIEGIGE